MHAMRIKILIDFIVAAALSTSVKPVNKLHSFKTRIKGLITKFQI